MSYVPMPPQQGRRVDPEQAKAWHDQQVPTREEIRAAVAFGQQTAVRTIVDQLATARREAVVSDGPDLVDEQHPRIAWWAAPLEEVPQDLHVDGIWVVQGHEYDPDAGTMRVRLELMEYPS